MPKITREKFKTYGNVFDGFTLRNLFKLESQGYFEEPLTPVALGKEANVFSAKRKDGKKVIIKIYRLESCDFNKMFDLIRCDDRYQNISKNRRNVIFAWTQREYRNLHKAREAGVAVPTPLHFFHNILIEEFIGDEEPAPKLKDSNVNRTFLKKTIDNMKKLNDADLVHGDLSSFNILNWRNDPILIDFSQTTERKSMHFEEYLERDISNVCKHFRKVGIKIDENDVLKKIMGKNI